MTGVLELNEIIEHGFDYREYLSQNDRSNTDSIAEMLRFLKDAMQRELTSQQRTCLWMSAIEGVPQRTIAKQLGVNASTVCRHIAAAKRKLKHVARYYQM